MSEYHAPNPCLIAILLTISTHAGPQFVCHYPPSPDTHDFNAATAATLNESESESDSSDAFLSDLSGDDEDETSTIVSNHQERVNTMAESLLDRLESRGRRRIVSEQSGLRDDRSQSMHRKSSDDTLSRDRERERESLLASSSASLARGLDSWHKVLGFEADFLSELLCPTRGMCNSKFELTVDDMVFLGLPIHVQQSGKWKEKPSFAAQSEGSTRKSKSTTRTKSTKNARGRKGHKRQNSESADDGDDEIESDEFDIPEEDEDEEKPDSQKNSSADFSDPRTPMRMFHIVFVMNPPATEFNQRVADMYRFVLTPFTRCLQYEQHRTNYVWKEASTLLNIRDEATAEAYSATRVWDEMKRKSPLALAIQQLYDAITDSAIANCKINNTNRSFQIPIQTEFRQLTPITSVRPEIAYLTTSGPFIDTVDESAEGLSANYGILLLAEPEEILREIQADPYSPIAAFIPEISPTQSIQMLSEESGLSTDHIIALTRNLMYWRRARAIVPIHHRNIYIVSPLAPMAHLYKYVPMFEERFPSLPSLPRMLSTLSTGRPRNFSAHIPSRDHRRVYLQALAWLLRYGFVTQLKTFLFIKISKRIKTAVYHEQADDEAPLTEESKKRTDTSTDNTSKQRQNSPTKMVAFLEEAGEPDSYEERLASSLQSEDSATHEVGEDSILTEPDRAGGLQRKWIAKMLEEKPQEVKNTFFKVMKYFNGKNTMEKAMVLENISRQDMRRLTSALEEHLVVVRHW